MNAIAKPLTSKKNGRRTISLAFSSKPQAPPRLRAKVNVRWSGISTIAGSTSVRLDNTISAQALLVTSATREIAATTPKNKNVGRPSGDCEGRIEPEGGPELNRTGAAGRTDATDAGGDSEACEAPVGDDASSAGTSGPT